MLKPDGEVHSGVYECREGVCGDACGSGEMHKEGGADLFCWGMLGGTDWVGDTIPLVLCHVGVGDQGH